MRLLSHASQNAADRRCGFPCRKRKAGRTGAPWWRGACSYRCGGPWDEQDFGLTEHLIRALGATYATLALLAIALSVASPPLSVAGMCSFTVWSLAQLASSDAPFLSPDDAERRVTFHVVLMVINTVVSARTVVYEF